jgi:nucleotide-binding universal stress UspA family protein
LPIKDLLLHFEAGDANRPVHDFALSLAARLGAHLTAAGIVLDTPPPVSDLGGEAPDWAIVNNDAVLAELSSARRQRLKDAYRTFAESAPAGVETELAVIQTFEQAARDQFARLAGHFDFTILSQGAADNQALDRMMFSSALFHSGRPVFLLPSAYQGPARLEKALVCWDGGAPAARALAASLPLLALAQSVEVACVADEGAQPLPEILPGFNITRHLARHGVAATLQPLAPAEDAASALLNHARDKGVDYLVMGAYSHWRLSEWIFGGTTRAILAATRMPVLLAH